MKGDFSRINFDPGKHYNAVMVQQGRVLTDYDTNVGQSIQAYIHETSSSDIIGRVGVPKGDPGFTVGLSGDKKRFTLQPGQIYVDGILVENEGPYETGAEEIKFPLGSGQYLVYLEVWKRLVTGVDDASLLEPALGGPDTTTRLQTHWRLRLTSAQTNDCKALLSGSVLLPKPTGTLKVTPAETGTAGGLCALPPEAGYLGLENQLYRVEIHRSGDRDNPANRASFKWSRDNGSVAIKVLNSTTTTIQVEHLGLDEVLGFANNDWVELVDTPADLDGRPGQLAQIDRMNPSNEILVKGSLSPVDLNQPVKLRRWDQSGPSATANGIPMTSGAYELENGIKLEFSPGTYRAGDYWVFPARTAITNALGTIEWPVDSGGNFKSIEPHGVKYHYAALALVDYDAATQTFSLPAASDCRPAFPPLTAITAQDVFFDNTSCGTALPQVKTVQEAIDALCQRQGGACQIQLAPVPGWETALSALAETDAEICFQTGLYPLDRRVVIRDKGHLKITGAGPGTRIVVAKDEAALVFENCESVTVRDLGAEAQQAGSSAVGEPLNRMLNGVLTFRNCGSVTAENLALKCASGTEPAATCITVSTLGQVVKADTGSSVRIQGCDLRVGHLQVGILVINATRTRIFDNQIRVGKKPDSLTLKRLLASRYYRTAVRQLLLHDVDLSEASLLAPGGKELVEFQGHAFLFSTDPILHNQWERLIKAIRPMGVQNKRHLFWHVQNVADRLLLNEGRYPGLSDRRTDEFARWYAQLREAMRTTADQGIVVSGTNGRDIHIQHNTIWGFHVGIRIGMSHRYEMGEPPDMAGNVQVLDNEISIFLSPAARLRFGIFLGNCERAVIQNNNIEVTRFPVTTKLPVEGIRAYGAFGEKIIIRQNSLLNTNTGIRCSPLTNPAKKLWLVADNVLLGAALSAGGFTSQNNVV